MDDITRLAQVEAQLDDARREIARLREALEGLTNHVASDILDVNDRLEELIAAARAALKEEEG